MSKKGSYSVQGVVGDDSLVAGNFRSLKETETVESVSDAPLDKTMDTQSKTATRPASDLLESLPESGVDNFEIDNTVESAKLSEAELLELAGISKTREEDRDSLDNMLADLHASGGAQVVDVQPQNASADDGKKKKKKKLKKKKSESKLPVPVKASPPESSKSTPVSKLPVPISLTKAKDKGGKKQEQQPQPSTAPPAPQEALKTTPPAEISETPSPLVPGSSPTITPAPLPVNQQLAQEPISETAPAITHTKLPETPPLTTPKEHSETPPASTEVQEDTKTTLSAIEISPATPTSSQDLGTSESFSEALQSPPPPPPTPIPTPVPSQSNLSKQSTIESAISKAAEIISEDVEKRIQSENTSTTTPDENQSKLVKGVKFDFDNTGIMEQAEEIDSKNGDSLVEDDSVTTNAKVDDPGISLKDTNDIAMETKHGESCSAETSVDTKDNLALLEYTDNNHVCTDASTGDNIQEEITNSDTMANGISNSQIEPRTAGTENQISAEKVLIEPEHTYLQEKSVSDEVSTELNEHGCLDEPREEPSGEMISDLQDAFIAMATKNEEISQTPEKIGIAEEKITQVISKDKSIINLEALPPANEEQEHFENSNTINTPGSNSQISKELHGMDLNATPPGDEFQKEASSRQVVEIPLEGVLSLTKDNAHFDDYLQPETDEQHDLNAGYFNPDDLVGANIEPQCSSTPMKSVLEGASESGSDVEMQPVVEEEIIQPQKKAIKTEIPFDESLGQTHADISSPAEQNHKQERVCVNESQDNAEETPSSSGTRQEIHVDTHDGKGRGFPSVSSNGARMSSISSPSTESCSSGLPSPGGQLSPCSPLDTSVAIAHSENSSLDSGTGSDHAVRHHGHFVVVAIDFGTTFSGYAFSFTRTPNSIHMMRKWEGGDPGVVNQKTPTVILFSGDGKFHSFGFAARDFYHDLDPQDAKKWLYFDRFKMTLHYCSDLTENTTIQATNGKSIPALKVFSESLRFFKEHALQELSDQSATKILNEDVRWVISVPAIWKQPAKQFMRRAAYEAGIACPDYPDQLLIALEPEAASIYCRKLHLHQVAPELPPKRPLSPKKEFEGTLRTTELVADQMTIGTRYMVADCGGGTVDITVHEIDDGQGNLKELYKATGGPYGSVGVDIEFENLLNNIFGIEFMEAFKHKRPAGFVDLMIAFESRKRTASPFKSNPLNVSLPFSFIDYYKKYKGGQVETAIRKYGDPDIRWSSQGMLRLTPSGMRRLFIPTLEKIRQTVGDVLNNPECKGVRYMFLVGGFAESQVLQQEVRKEFGHILKIVIPQDVTLTILRGAVLFGLDPTVVHVRRSRLTYGVGVLNRFNTNKHPKNKRISKDGVEWCTDVFDTFVATDQSVALGDTVLRSYTPAKQNQKSSIINIYSSERPDAKFITDAGVRKCGQLCLDLSAIPGARQRREIQTRMIFGDTEIKVSALDVATGQCVKSAIDFLNK